MIFSPRLPTQAPKTKITPHVTNQTHPTGQLPLKSLAHGSAGFAELFIFNGLILISFRAIRKRRRP
jgi:hypothetical protein